MESYLIALEAFEKETQEVYLDYMMGTFMATEGIGSSVATKVKQGWEFIKKIFRQIRDTAKRIGRMILGALKKFFNVVKRCPDEIVVDDPEVAAYVKLAAAVLDGDSDDMLTVDKLMERYRTLVNTLTEQTSRTDATMDEVDKGLDKMKALQELYDTRYKKLTQKGDEIKSDDESPKEKKRIKINIGGLKNRLLRNGKKAEAQAKANEKEISDTEAKLDKVAADAEKASDEDGASVEEQTKKQGIFSKLLRLIGSIGNFIKSIPSRIASLFSKLMSFRSKAKVEDYDGPSPVIG
jgi:hypothetical protein